MTDFKEIATAAEEYVIDIRRQLHMHPETRWNESETLAFIQQQIGLIHEENGGDSDFCTVAITRMKGGLVVDVTFNDNWQRRLFRADVDGLPIQEQTELSFCSKRPGVMHACGHDMHSAMLLGAFKLIRDGKIQPTYNLRFVWQCAEENPGSLPMPESGGNTLVNEGNVLDGITDVHALHVKSDLPSGTFFTGAQAVLGNSDRMEIKITGASGGHVMKPSSGVNANDVVFAIMTSLQSFLARHVSPTEPATLVCTGIQSGSGLASSNIMPSEALMHYGVRNLLNESDRASLYEKLQAEIIRIAESFGAKAEVEMVFGHPTTINTDTAEMQSLLTNAGLTVQIMDPELGGEDFAYYLQKRPGSFWFLGADGGNPTAHHSSTFNPDESVMTLGVAFWLTMATAE
ncbi:amidohydrolase [Patescibacteria group bacterium]|nr:amidohydrolase [Patescibacteria group bacterium]MBU0964246.1 amidohydrolase [Patescibacteria group bacterium]